MIYLPHDTLGKARGGEGRDGTGRWDPKVGFNPFFFFNTKLETKMEPSAVQKIKTH